MGASKAREQEAGLFRLRTTVEEIHEISEREVRDLPVFEFRTTVVTERYRLRCPECGPKIERVDQLPSKAPFSKRFEEAVGQACEGASARQVAHRFRLAESTVRAIDLRYLKRWAAKRNKPALRQLGVDEIHLGKFHVMQHADKAMGGRLRGLVKGKRWLLLTRWLNLTSGKRQEWNHLFALNRKLLKA